MVGDSRMNIAGLNADTVPILAASIAKSWHLTQTAAAQVPSPGQVFGQGRGR